MKLSMARCVVWESKPPSNIYFFLNLSRSVTAEVADSPSSRLAVILNASHELSVPELKHGRVVRHTDSPVPCFLSFIHIHNCIHAYVRQSDVL